MKKVSLLLLAFTIILSVLTGCSSEDYELYSNPTYLPSPDEVTDCDSPLREKKKALDDYIICMGTVANLDAKNDSDVMKIANVIRDCSDEINEYDLKSDSSCLPIQAKLMTKLNTMVLDFMNCTTEARFEESYLANYLFCHADMMNTYNTDFFEAWQNYINK